MAQRFLARQTYSKWVVKRITWKPVAYITHERNKWQLEFYIITILKSRQESQQITKLYKCKQVIKKTHIQFSFTFDLPFSLVCLFEDEPMLSSLSSRLNCCEFMEVFEPNSSKTLSVNVSGADKFTLLTWCDGGWHSIDWINTGNQSKAKTW